MSDLVDLLLSREIIKDALITMLIGASGWLIGVFFACGSLYVFIMIMEMLLWLTK